MPGIPEVMDLLDKIQAIHRKKNEDYSEAGEPFQNFERSAFLAEWFDGSVDKAFVVLIGTKMARLATLLNSGKEPNNESVADSFLDLTAYCALWSGYHAYNKQPGVKFQYTGGPTTDDPDDSRKSQDVITERPISSTRPRASR